MKRQRSPVAPPLSTLQFTRWIWRQLTSMRTALLLLLLLALAAIPGSLLPQQGVDAQQVRAFRIAHPTAAPVLDTLGLFSVYSSPWFSAIYLLLAISLIGCFVPRIMQYVRALRARPPSAPRNFNRLPQWRTYETAASPTEVLSHARRVLRRKRARVDVVPAAGGADAGGEVRAETGYLREAGNLVFHVCVLIVLVGVAAGSLLGYRGFVIVTEGNGFSNALTQYDEFTAGAWVSPDDLPPFSLTLDDLTAEFQPDGPQRGAPKRFEATGSYAPGPNTQPRPYDIEVNHPLEINGTSVFLVGQGYAPVVKVTDGNGDVAFEGPVPFLPKDGSYTSTGVIKVPDARPSQLGFQGYFLPTAAKFDDGSAPVSIFPGAANPNLGLFAYFGDLGMDSGSPQSVYSLDKNDLTQMTGNDGQPFRVSLSAGQVADLPGGRGSIEFVGLKQFARFRVATSPLASLPLWGTVVGVLGLTVSLWIRPRRIWIRTRRRGGQTLVEVAALERVPRGDLATDIDELITQLHTQHAPEKTEDRATPEEHHR